MTTGTKSRTIVDFRHPEWEALCNDWRKFRLTYQSDCQFREEFLVALSAREDKTDFKNRKHMTYIPAFARVAVKEIENAVSQRIDAIIRKGGPTSYEEAITGKLGGVDLHGRDMNQFIVTEVLPELLQIGKVGVYIDNAVFTDESLMSSNAHHPYLYTYPAESILSWKKTPTQSGSELVSLLLQDTDILEEGQLNLPTGLFTKFRFLELLIDPETNKRFVRVKIFNDKGAPLQTTDLDIPKIPFVFATIKNSLLQNTADIQICLMNLASSDLAYLLKSNFPFYTEQYDPIAHQDHLLRQPDPDIDGTAESAKGPTKKEITVGNTDGRQYPKGVDRPGFISPPTDSVKISMEKQEQMKADIRRLTFLSVASLNPVSASAESKKQNVLNMEAGLSAIGMVLELAEREIANIWSLYENKTSPEIATIIYPSQYSLMSEEDRHLEAKNKRELLGVIPSITYKKAIAKQIALITVGDKVSNEDFEKILKEIENAEHIIADKDLLIDLKREGGIDTPTFSELGGLSKEIGEKALKEVIVKTAAIVEAQAAASKQVLPNAGARGVDELDPDDDSGRKEKAVAKFEGAPTRGRGRD